MQDPTHHDADRERVQIAAVTISDTRTPETDRGGDTLAELAEAAGHAVVDRRIVPDEPHEIGRVLGEFCSQAGVDAVLMTGGTGVSARDQTFETVEALLTKTLPGYGELMRVLSYEQIGPKAMLSRAIGGVIGRTLVFTMPGSPAAVELAMQRLILPELGHLVREASK